MPTTSPLRRAFARSVDTQEGPGDVLVGITSRKRTAAPRGGDQDVELGHQALAVAVERGRGGMWLPRLSRKRTHPTLLLQAGDVAPDPDAVHRGASEADILGQ